MGEPPIVSAIPTETAIWTPTQHGGSVKFGGANDYLALRRIDQRSGLMSPNGRKLDGFASQSSVTFGEKPLIAKSIRRFAERHIVHPLSAPLYSLCTALGEPPK
uniref:Uncharacterized protein n=1 Tax=Solanum tuberosum TaxID=4113 RepID=M1DQB4_SOLTU